MTPHISIYSSLSQSLIPLVPLEEGHVRMYACGITVYDDAHLGHARQAIVFDVIRRYLEFRGYKVSYVRNFTDVDDKIIARAKQAGTDPLELSSLYIARSSEDLDALGVLPATIEPKVTEHIPEIISLIQDLVRRGAAYESSGDVLFDVSTFERYGALSRRSLTDCLNSDESRHKRQPQDFVLWKQAKPGEPSWESPWGPGRPGWHIECSAMVRTHLGDTIDIHGGGIDLLFPHHENEMAQSESATERPLANCWVHNGLVMVDGRKMSKSFGNFLSIRDVLKAFPAEVVRYAVLTHKYSSNIDFKADLFVDAMTHVVNAYKVFARIDELPCDSTARAEDGAAVSELRTGFMKAMDEDFNSAVAISFLGAALATVRKELIPNRTTLSPDIRALAEGVRTLGNVLGLFSANAREFLTTFQQRGLGLLATEPNAIEAELACRTAAKSARKFTEADAIRTSLEGRGISVADLPGGGTEWSLNPRKVAEALANEILGSSSAH